jgi:hypothetical protein
MASKVLTNKHLIRWLFYFLEIFGLAPFKSINSHFFLSQTKLGLSVVLQIILTVLTFWKIRPLLLLQEKSLFGALEMYWTPTYMVIIIIVRWAFLISSRYGVRFLRLLHNSRTNDIPIGRCTLLLIVTHLATTAHQIYIDCVRYDYGFVKSSERTTAYFEQFLVEIFYNFLDQPYFLLAFTFNISMEQITKDLQQIIGLLDAKTILDSNTEHSKNTLKRKEIVYEIRADSSFILAKIKSNIIKCQHSMCLLRMLFSLPALGVLAYEQLEMVKTNS